MHPTPATCHSRCQWKSCKCFFQIHWFFKTGVDGCCRFDSSWGSHARVRNIHKNVGWKVREQQCPCAQRCQQCVDGDGKKQQCWSSIHRCVVVEKTKKRIAHCVSCKSMCWCPGGVHAQTRLMLSFSLSLFLSLFPLLPHHSQYWVGWRHCNPSSKNLGFSVIYRWMRSCLI